MDWDRIREEFPVTRNWAFLDHAAVAPMCNTARQALIAWAGDVTEHGGVHDGQWRKVVELVRALAAKLIHAEPNELAFIKNTSEGICFVAEGLSWLAGDNVVTAAEEYPSNIYPWMNLANRGVEVRLVQSREGRLWFEDIEAAVDGRTRLISLSFVEFASGFRNDLDRISEFCREKGILFFVDAIQGLGVLPLDVQRTPVDFLSADGHKWLLGPEGAGIFYIRKDLVDRLHPISVGWHSVVGWNDFSRIDFRLKPGAGRWESGTFNTGGIAALGASLDLLLKIGIANVWDQVRFLTDDLCERAQRAGFDVYSSRREEDKSGIVSLHCPDNDPRAYLHACFVSGIAINQRAGRLRVSPHCYNTTEELERLVQTLVRVRSQRVSSTLAPPTQA